MLDILISNGKVIDDSGSLWYRADVGVQDGRRNGTFPGRVLKTSHKVRHEAREPRHLK